jgi:O-antigen/teichoic acid export membrane protein
MSSPNQISLKQRVLNAGVWRLAGYGISQTIRFGSNLLMTRLLVPEMFGVMAIAMLVITGLAMFSDLGLKQSIIQSKRGHDPAFLNTAWVVQIFRGVALSGGAVCIALLLLFANSFGFVPKDSVYANPSLPYVIAILSVLAVIAGFQSTKLFEASRNLLLAQVTKIELAAQIIGLLCMIGWVSIDRSIWALVAGTVCSLVATTVMSHTWLPGIVNRWQWDQSAAHELIHFGKWILISSILGFLVSSGDRLLLGGLISPNELGVYVIAFTIFSSIQQIVTKIIGDVMYPALSEIIRERPANLKRDYYRFFVPTASVVYFCAGILMIFGHSLIVLLYDPRYEQAGWMLQVLAAALLTIPFYITASCFLALGFSRLFSNLIAIRAVTLFLLIPMGFHFFGLQGALVGIVISYFSSLPTIIFFMIKHRLFDMWKELLPLSAGIAGMLFAAGLNLLAGH